MLALTIRLASLMLTVRYLATLETLIINSTLQSSRDNINLESRALSLTRQAQLLRPYAANNAKHGKVTSQI